jgi:RimJ/RimL family protein N-acetyltransferase
VKVLVKQLLAWAVAEYRINWIFAIALPGADIILPPSERIVRMAPEYATMLAESSTAKMRSSLSYMRAGLDGFVLLDDDRPLAVVHYATSSQYERAETWSLREGEVALLDIVTEEAARGTGLAVRLLEQTTAQYLRQGVKRLIAFIWWSNEPSVRAFRKSGWRRIGLSVEWKIGPRWFHIHVPLP